MEATLDSTGEVAGSVGITIEDGTPAVDPMLDTAGVGVRISEGMPPVEATLD